MENGAMQSAGPGYGANRTLQQEAGAVSLVHGLLSQGARGAYAGGYRHQAVLAEDPMGTILQPVSRVVEQLILARKSARTQGVTLKIFAGTEARHATAVADDSDGRDHRYLCGTRAAGGFFYCGGLEAAIDRALHYAPHADVVCLKSEKPEMAGAQRFAQSLRAAFPEIELAFTYAPKPDGIGWNELEHASFRARLQRLGYNYYFHARSGDDIFPCFSASAAWVLFDDVQRGESPLLKKMAGTN